MEPKQNRRAKKPSNLVQDLLIEEYFKMDSAFGGLDLDDIPESVIKGTYQCDITEANLREMTREELDKDLGRKTWFIKFTVADGEYVGETGTFYINLYTSENLGQDPDTKLILLNGEPVDPSTQQEIRDAIKNYRTFATALGFSKEEIKAGADFTEKVENGERYFVSMYSDSSKQTKISTRDPIRPVKSTDSSELDSLQL